MNKGMWGILLASVGLFFVHPALPVVLAGVILFVVWEYPDGQR